jgi:hypothetical protein
MIGHRWTQQAPIFEDEDDDKDDYDFFWAVDGQKKQHSTNPPP